MTIFSEDGKFEWDSDKDSANRSKHGFSVLEVFEG